MSKHAGRVVIGIGFVLFLMSCGTMPVGARDWKERPKEVVEGNEIKKRQTMQVFKEEVDRVLESLLREGLRLDRISDFDVEYLNRKHLLYKAGQAYRHPRWPKVVVCVTGEVEHAPSTYDSVAYYILPKGAEEDVRVEWKDEWGRGGEISIIGPVGKPGVYVTLRGVDKPEDVRRLRPEMRQAIEKMIAEVFE